jgi:hypothetical protein
MAVHRISDRAEMLLQRLAAAEAKKPAQFLSELIIDYAAGLTFDDPDLEKLEAPEPEREMLQAPNPEEPTAPHDPPRTTEET